jgi:hypothetical protein
MIQQPFIYTFDADTAGLGGIPLVDGQSYRALALNLNSDAPFILRRIAGLPNIGVGQPLARWRLYNQQGAYMQSGPSLVANQPDYPIIPEMAYDPGAQIRMDLDNIGLGAIPFAAGGSTPNYYSQVAFQGVKIFQGTGYQTPYRYYERYYTYTQELTIDYAGRLPSTYTSLTSPGQYSVEMNDYDFELLYVNLGMKVDGATTITPTENKAKMMILDQYQNQLMSAPVLAEYLDWGSGVNNSVFPCPGVVYPVGSFIRYSIQSLLIESQVPATMYVSFVGKWRRSC